MQSEAQRNRVSAVAAASDPVREALFSFALRIRGEFSRDEAAEALGIPRSTAAFHLEKLSELGLLGVEYRRRGDRSGPGAGRPAKFYRAQVDEVAASIPERHYDLAAEVLSATVEYSDRTGTSVRESMDAVATTRGRVIGRSAASLDSALHAGGYEPQMEGTDTVLTNCPFHHLTENHTATICALNHALLRGVVEGVGDDPDRAEFSPSPTRCCVRIAAVAEA